MPHKKCSVPAEVSTDNNEPAKYIGVTVDDFKTRHRNHTKSFTNKNTLRNCQNMYGNWKQQRNHFPSHGRCLRTFLPAKLVLEDATFASRKNWLFWKTRTIDYWTSDPNYSLSTDMKHDTSYHTANTVESSFTRSVSCLSIALQRETPSSTASLPNK